MWPICSAAVVVVVGAVRPVVVVDLVVVVRMRGEFGLRGVGSWAGAGGAYAAVVVVPGIAFEGKTACKGSVTSLCWPALSFILPCSARASDLCPAPTPLATSAAAFSASTSVEARGSSGGMIPARAQTSLVEASSFFTTALSLFPCFSCSVPVVPSVPLLVLVVGADLLLCFFRCLFSL